MPLRGIVEDSFRTIEATEPEADVAYVFNQYHLISCPVVDSAGRLVGVITQTDLVRTLATAIQGRDEADATSR